MNPEYDERHGVPSASAVPLLNDCIASHKMKQACPKRSAGAMAEHGNDVHGILSDDIDPDEVSYSAAETAEMCDEHSQYLLNDWLREGEEYQVYNEIRLGITALGKVIKVTPESKATFVFTGKFDRLYVQGGRGLLIDFKSLHGHHPHAVENGQLASQAPMVWQFYGLTELRTALIQPWKGRPTLADYDKSAIIKATSWLFNLIDREAKATPDSRTPGAWCSKCDASGYCDKAHKHMQDTMQLVNPETLPANSKALFAETISRVLNMPAEEHARMEKSRSMIGTISKAIHDASIQRAESDPEFQRFFTLREKNGKRSIDDSQAVWSKCHEHGVTPEDFTEKCSIGIGSVKELLKKATKKKGKELDKLADEVISGCTKSGNPTKELVPTINRIEE